MARQLLLIAAATLATAGTTAAQYPYPYQPAPYGAPAASPAGPVLSPYLNLLNGPTGNAGVNYFNFVRPQLQLQQQQQVFGGGGAIAAIDPYPLASEIVLDPTTRLPRSTGLPVQFMNYGPYFNSMGTMGRAGIRPGGASTAAAPTVPNVPRR